MEQTQFFTSNGYGMHLDSMVVGMLCLAFMSNFAFAVPAATPNTKVQVQSGYGSLPLSFEANHGQADTRVKYLSRGQGYTLFLAPAEAVLSLNKPQAKASPLAKLPLSSEVGSTVLRMQIVGANLESQILGKDTLPGRVNYLIGKDARRWHTRIPTYQKVIYESVYPGVDLVYYGNQGKLEYDFVVAPGGDPHQVRLAFGGADKIEVNPAGELVLHMESGDILMRKPVLFQNIQGARKPIEGSYVVKDDQNVGFQVAAYDPAHPLVIDPVLVYSTYLGGSGDEESYGIAVDKVGQAYVAGRTSSPDFPIAKAGQHTLNGDSNVFVAKLRADGKALLYSTYLGGSGTDGASSIAVDQQGKVYVTGRTTSQDFPIANAEQPMLNGPSDAFIARLTTNGTGLLYSTYLGGSGEDEGDDIAVDWRNQAYVTGQSGSTDFPTHNAFQPSPAGAADAFVAKLTASGSSLLYSTYLGGSGTEGGTGIVVDKKGQVYVTGFTNSSNFPTHKAFQPSFGGGPADDAFVAKFTDNGSTLLYSTYLGGSSSDAGTDIAVDKSGQAYVTGATVSPNFPTVNALKSAFDGHSDAFVAKFAANGATLRYSTYFGGAGFEVGTGIAVDDGRRAYVTGWTELSDFPTKNAFQSTSGGQVDAYAAQFTSNGAALHYSTFLGGEVGDISNGIAIDSRGGAYVTGFTNSHNFPVVNALQPAFATGSPEDIFVARIGSNNRNNQHQKIFRSELPLRFEPALRSESTIRDHLSSICQSGLKAFACRLAHYGVN